jgi:hypothetical protein
MSISHRTNRLKLLSTPSVEQLQNGRYRLTVNCTTLNSRDDWYSANKDRIFPDFGSLQSAEMSIDGLAPRVGEAYANMRLTSVQSDTRSLTNGGDYIVVLTYETIGNTFVQVKDDTTDYKTNGLRTVSRSIIAEPGTSYGKTIGESFIDHQINTETAVRCYLASYKIDDTDSYRGVEEVYIEAGILSETLDSVGSQQAKVIESIGPDPATPSGYVLASKQESDFEGFQTNRFTFLKPDVELSNSEDNVGSQKAIIEEWFKPVTGTGTPADNRNVKTNYSLAKEETSDVNGIPTVRYSFLKNDVQLSKSEDNVGSQKAIIEEWFNPDPENDRNVKTDYSLAKEEVSDVEGIPTERYTFLKPSVLSRDIDTRDNGKLRVETVESFSLTPISTIGGVLISQVESDVEGIPTKRYVYALGLGEVSRTVDDQLDGAITYTTVDSLGFITPAPGAYETSTREEDGYTIYTSKGITVNNSTLPSRVNKRNNGKLILTTYREIDSQPTGSGVLIDSDANKSEGYTLFTATYAVGSGVISTKTDKRYEGLLTITTTTSIGSSSGINNISSTTREEDGYVLYVNVGASGSGIISNTTDERSNGVIKINRIVSVGAAVAPVGTLIGTSERKSEGHTVYETTGALGSGQISTSTRPGPSQIIGTRYTTVRSVGVKVTPPGVVTAESSTESDGYVTYEVTALQGTIEGTKMTYKDVVDVEVPGTVHCTTEAVSISDGTLGTIGGTIAIPKITPPRSKKINATVTVEVTTSPANAGSIAYDLGQISCSVTSTNENYASRNGPTKTYKSGIFKFNVLDWQRSYSPSARIQSYPKCYLTSSSSFGEVSFQSALTNVIAGDGGSLESQVYSYSTNQTSCTGTGSTAANDYVTSGIVNRVSRPVLTALDGTTYFEVITWTAI